MPFSLRHLLVTTTLLLTITARPHESKRWASSSSTSSNPSSLSDITKRWGLAASNCDMSSATGNMNLAAADPPLPPPASSLSLFQVVLGRGTQNYTCDLTNTTAVPTPIGALATLFDISCLAATAPELLSILPIIALNLPVPDTSDPTSPMAKDMSGHHYFLDATTPFFNLDTANHNYGMGALQKANASDAPDGAYAGPDGQGNGAVQWLKLDVKPYVEDKWKQIYRLDTAGGTAPALCTGQPASFEVPYAAVYWLFT